MKGLYVKGAVAGFVLMMFVSSPALTLAPMPLEYAQAAAAEEGTMAELQLILKKLRSSMASMKDFDELEKAGMSRRDVERMRRAMRKKIEQLTDDAITAIRSL